jgi:4-hydroxy-2-oxoheptanedioate aldolase
MRKMLLQTVPVLAAMLAAPAIAQESPAYVPKRINKAIELLEQGQPVYYTTASGGYEQGLELADTEYDYINYGMEHGAFDIAALRDFMRGLDEASMRANYWVVHQVLAAGVHGILLCHARDPKAAEVFVAAARYPFAPLNPDGELLLGVKIDAAHLQ